VPIASPAIRSAPDRIRYRTAAKLDRKIDKKKLREKYWSNETRNIR